MKTCLFGVLWMLMCLRGVEGGNSWFSPNSLQTLFVFDKAASNALRYFHSSSKAAKSYLEMHNRLVTDVAEMRGNHSYAPLENPLHIYELIKRLVVFWPEARSHFNGFIFEKDNKECRDTGDQCMDWQDKGMCAKMIAPIVKFCPVTCGICHIYDAVKTMLELETQITLPQLEDATRVSELLSRLQHLYSLPMSDLIEGRIHLEATSVRLNVWDCIYLGRISMAHKMWMSSYLWYKSALPLAPDIEMAKYIQYLINYAARTHDLSKKKDDDDHFPKSLAEIPDQVPRRSNQTKQCLDDTPAKPNETLQCHISSLNSHYLLLQPLKYEILKQDPEVICFFDGVFNNEIATLLQLSQVMDANGTNEKRVSMESSPDLSPLSRRLAHMMNISDNYISYGHNPDQSLMIYNYGVGDYSKRHVSVNYNHTQNLTDSQGGDSPGNENAIVILYLNDVPAGGRDVFSRAEISIQPRKGMALVWKNLDTDEKYKNCPVLMGNKLLAIAKMRTI